LHDSVPDALRNRVIVFLQHGSAVGTDWFFSVANIPFSRDGVVIALPTVSIEIAQECSGIRSSFDSGDCRVGIWGICFWGKPGEICSGGIARSSYNAKNALAYSPSRHWVCM